MKLELRNLQPEDARKLAALLDHALDLADDERRSWQDGLAQSEPEWAELLANMLSELASTIAADGGRARRAAPEPLESLRGRQFGPYRVERLLGRGGMGSVWLARRTDGLFEREVALKLPHASANAAGLRERFARERRILAALAHPNIAQLLDAGSEGSQPYLALEYVAGQSLTEYCDARRLPIDKRVELMLQVLLALQHAHQNLVVHRDLKPSNILVTQDGHAHLLDFGIAKLIPEGVAGETELTRMVGRAFTPEYASPEQITGHPLTTASDVYSIGVVLYVLLAGRRPYKLERESRGALEEAIVSAEPSRLSQRPIDPSVAAERSTTAPKLARALAGDLETIVQKALKKDPQARYPTADALRQDLLRYLAGEPVLARPDSFAYRAAKFMRRNRVGVASALGVALLLLTAAGVSLRQAELARAQAAVARREAERARAVEGFLLGVFGNNSDQQADPVRARQATARELLDTGSRTVADSLAASPEAQAEVCDKLADMYHQLGLGAGAARMRQLRVSALERAFGPGDQQVAAALILLADDLSQLPDLAQAKVAVTRAGRILDQLHDETSETRGLYWLMAADLAKSVSISDMRRYARQALAQARAHPSPHFWSNTLFALQLSAQADQLRGDYERAEAGYEETLKEIERRGQAESAWSVLPLTWLAQTQQMSARFDEAEHNLRHALALSVHFNGPDAALTLQTQLDLGAYLFETGSSAAGREMIEDTRRALESANENVKSATLPWLRRVEAAVLYRDGRLAEARANLELSLSELRANTPGSIPLARALLQYAAVLDAQGQVEAAGDAANEALRVWSACAGSEALPAANDPYRLARARNALARADLASAEVEAGAVDAADAGQHLLLDRIRAELLLARVRAEQARWDDGLALAQRALSSLRAAPLAGRYAQLEAEALVLIGRAQP